MSATRGLTAFAERKRLLVLQADLYRTALRAECVYAQARLSWLKEARHKAQSAGPWLAVGAAAVGLLAASRRRTLARWIPIALAAWRGVQKSKTS